MRMESEVMKASNPKLPTAGAPRSSRTKPLTFEDFSPDTEMNENQRAAQFLDWCARNLPGRFAPYVWITKHAYIKTKLPRLDNIDVEALRKKRMDSVKKILWTEYHRRTVAAPRDQEPGVRATTDSDDLAGTDYLRRTRRIASGVKAAAETREKIDVAEMHNKDLKAMVERTDPIMKQLNKADLLKRLELPPRRPDED
jgi:hypothetical protein